MDLKYFLRNRDKLISRLNNMDLMFEAYLTHESNAHTEPDDIPQTAESVWILGKEYSAINGLEEIRRDIRSRLWFSYRKTFIPIGDSGITTDKGWGCMLRCGQMVMAQALLFIHLGRGWKWSPSTRDPTYLKILRMFEDRRTGVYSIHQIALTGASEGKQIGEWFGPNTIAQVLKKLATYDDLSSLVVHVAMDNILVASDVSQLCKKREIEYCAGHAYNTAWKPLLLIIPLRLGLTHINPIYLPAFKACFTFPQSIGVIGGKPNHALYFIGYVGDDAIFLDPHTTQVSAAVYNKETEFERKADLTYHCQFASRLNITDMDPSVAMCFLCHSEVDFLTLCQLLRDNLVSVGKHPFFEVVQEPLRNWSSTMLSYDIVEDPFSSLSPFSVIGSPGRQIDESDDDFEMLG